MVVLLFEMNGRRSIIPRILPKDDLRGFASSAHEVSEKPYLRRRSRQTDKVSKNLIGRVMKFLPSTNHHFHKSTTKETWLGI
jgi:hypothetical protein